MNNTNTRSDAYVKFFRDHTILYSTDNPNLFYIMYNKKLCLVKDMHDALETIMITPCNSGADIGGGVGLPVFISFKKEVNPNIIR